MNNDLISRERLKNTILLGNYDTQSKILSAINNAPTVAVDCKECDGYEAGYSAGLKDAERPTGEWIPVSERLPEQANQSYLVTVDYGDGLISSCQRFFFGEGIGWNDDCVIAWQPLPEPYKEGGAE